MQKEPQAAATGLGLCPRDCLMCWGYRARRKDGEARDKLVNAMASDTSSLRPLKEASVIVPECGVWWASLRR